MVLDSQNSAQREGSRSGEKERPHGPVRTHGWGRDLLEAETPHHSPGYSEKTERCGS